MALTSFFVLSLQALVAGAAAVGRPRCQLHLSVGGAISGSVGQITSGQVRAGQGIQTAAFGLEGDELIDSQGRGCWWTPPTGVLQCDQGQRPDKGFVVGCDGTVSYRGRTSFSKCDTGEAGQYNIYLEPHGVNCAAVTLKADTCRAACPAPAPKPQPVAPRVCPANLAGPYEFPHLIVVTDKSQPGKASGASYFGELSPSQSSIFNFDIPSADKGKTCSLVFMLPRQSELQTSSYSMTGDGRLRFTALAGAASTGTTYGNKPAKKHDIKEVTVSPGNGYVLSTFACPAGQQVTVEVSSVHDAKLKYFQDYNPAPIGLYITKC